MMPPIIILSFPCSTSYMVIHVLNSDHDNYSFLLTPKFIAYVVLADIDALYGSLIIVAEPLSTIKSLDKNDPTLLETV